jgi:hypothetical protein
MTHILAPKIEVLRPVFFWVVLGFGCGYMPRIASSEDLTQPRTTDLEYVMLCLKAD